MQPTTVPPPMADPRVQAEWRAIVRSAGPDRFPAIAWPRYWRRTAKPRCSSAISTSGDRRLRGGAGSIGALASVPRTHPAARHRGYGSWCGWRQVFGSLLLENIQRPAEQLAASHPGRQLGIAVAVEASEGSFDAAIPLQARIAHLILRLLRPTVAAVRVQVRSVAAQAGERVGRVIAAPGKRNIIFDVVTLFRSMGRLEVGRLLVSPRGILGPALAVESRDFATARLNRSGVG